MRIASLIPSGTDIACALGLAPQLVGISHACDHPAAAGLPVLTRSVVDAGRPPAEIDAAVNQAVQEGTSLYLTDRELLRQLQPDVVLTQTICDVCAVNGSEAARALPPGAQLVNLSATSFAGLWQDIAAVANAAGVSARDTLTTLQEKLAVTNGRAVTAQEARRIPIRPKVLVLEWSDPFFLGGHWVPEMVELAGGNHLLSKGGIASRRATAAEVLAAAPEILILAPCGYNLEQTVTQGQELLQLPEIQATPAFARGQIWATNATALFSRCTPASVRATEVLAAIFYPEEFGAPAASDAVPLRQN